MTAQAALLGASATSTDRGKLRAQLMDLKLSELKQRAREVGVAAPLLDAADDSPNVKMAVVALLLGPNAG
jgi:hypothetical protein